MNKTELMTNVTRTIKRTGFKIKKYSPEILIVAGVIGTVTSAVMACKATTKVSEILDKAKEDIDSVKECREKSNNNDLPENEVYTEEDSKKDLTIIYAQTGVKFAKLYAPSVVLGALSLTAIISSHNILRKRNVALAAAYMTVDKSFKDYRGRVAERFGTDAEREIRYNIKAKDIAISVPSAVILSILLGSALSLTVSNLVLSVDDINPFSVVVATSVDALPSSSACKPVTFAMPMSGISSIGTLPSVSFATLVPISPSVRTLEPSGMAVNTFQMSTSVVPEGL